MLDLQPASQAIYEQKYQLKDHNGFLVDESISDTFYRVAKTLASVEKPEEREKYASEFLYALENGFLPAGRILANIGAEAHKPNTSTINCVVSDGIPDSIEGILQKVKESAISLAAGCGIGYCFSTLRPQGSFINGVGATTSGTLSFMEIYNTMCFTIASAGGRRGAQMATLHDWHPQIIDFIKAKQENGKFRQFNFSVLISNEFMEAVEKNEDWELYFPIHRKEYDSLVNVNNLVIHIPNFPFKSPDYVTHSDNEGIEYTICKVYKTLKARELWDIITKSTYEYAEPGVLFIDRINEGNPLNFCETIVATNPCGEQPLPPYGACLLGSVNLTHFVENPFTPAACFNLEKFKKVVRISARLLDNVIAFNGLPLSSQREEIMAKRRHGMGFTGLGSLLNILGIPYGSDAAIGYTDTLSSILALENLKVSITIAKEKGCAPIFDALSNREQYLAHPYIKKLFKTIKPDESETLYKDALCYGFRWTHGTSIAPTGTISFSLGNNCSNGIEPTFAISNERNVIKERKKSKEQVTVHSYEALLWRNMHGDKPFPENFVTTNDLSPSEHIDMQAICQTWIDSSISKTINVPSDISFEAFKNVYVEAYRKGLKGCTTYRYNPEVSTGVLVKKEDLEKTFYKITLEDGTSLTVKGTDMIEYDGETHLASNLCDAIKEGYYGKF